MPITTFPRRGAIVLAVLAACACAALGLHAAPDASAASGWTSTGSMSEGRSAAAAVLLADGRVLVAGGFSGSVEVASSEIYDPATGTWTTTGSLNTGRHYAAMTRLVDGTVLITGGTTGGGTIASAERYDPATGVWTPVASMLEARDGHGATLLADGRVLVAGGGFGVGTPAWSQAEIYDPVADTWTATGAMAQGRENHAQLRLADGRVLVAGGHTSSPSLTFFASAELYDPATGTWSPAGNMATDRSQGGSALLGDGRVLYAGGVNRGGFLLTAERYDPVANSWSPAGSLAAVGNIAYGASLANGGALVVNDGVATNPARYDQAANDFLPAGDMSTTRALPTLTALPDGRVLVAGGAAGGTRLTSAELWTGPTTRTIADTDFGAVADGSAAERDVTVTNSGTLPLFPTGVSLGGPDAGAFSVVGDGCTGVRVAVGADCTIRVRFAAAGTGARTAQLLVSDNADGAPVPALTGTAAAAPGPGSVGAPPVIEALDRTQSDPAGGGLLEITGSNFSDGTVVRFDDVVAVTTVVRHDRLRVVVPPHAPGTVALTARTAAGTSAPVAFTYVSPQRPLAPAPSGEQPGARCVVPDLRGRRVRGARRALSAAGCTLGSVRRTTRRAGPRRAKVVRQSQRAGTALAAGAAVDVTTRKRRR